MLIDETISKLKSERQSFTDNVNDSFGRTIIDDVYDPELQILNALKGAMEQADSEAAMIKKKLTALRAII